jgi:hypothetical protein
MTVFPRLAGIVGTRSARQIRIAGAIHAGYSRVTAHPLGIVKVLPFKAHPALAATPFVTGQWRNPHRKISERAPAVSRARALAA